LKRVDLPTLGNPTIPTSSIALSLSLKRVLKVKATFHRL
jgi:hypothetical protein